ncbi:MAG: arginine repressor [Acidobacteriota bacterium]
MQKSDRQKAILNIISAQRVSRQDELADALHREGFVVTQASVSRDLDELGVVKLNGRYARQRPETALLPFGLVSVVKSGDSLIVAKCASGLASAAAVRIDAADLPGIAGTIAGDDTIFVAINKGAPQDAIANALYELFTFDNGGI